MAAQEPNEIQILVKEIARLMAELERAELALARALEENLEVLARAREEAGLPKRA